MYARADGAPHALRSLRFCLTRLQVTPAFRTEAYSLHLCIAEYPGERFPTEPTILPVCWYLLVTHRTPTEPCLRGLHVRPIEGRSMIKAPCEQQQLINLLASADRRYHRHRWMRVVFILRTDSTHLSRSVTGSAKAHTPPSSLVVLTYQARRCI